ncbi:hypothetical protein Cgig2_010764 [Carnegiea gigantea]|uniref:Plant heme peroxidase family profile domain-containing protein n=1 Tax=Carnegiea gigantea TaxID=171969 RepID=A0A9Q1Q4Q4_9CARY|nr:hypothetical protein Cgig2_010764 [Carnegiea gigantea]
MVNGANCEYLKQIEDARIDLRNLLCSNQQMAPIVLRLAFHDAATYDWKSHTGGANGSIRDELNNPPNKGLDTAVKFLEPSMSICVLLERFCSPIVLCLARPRPNWYPSLPSCSVSFDTWPSRASGTTQIMIPYPAAAKTKPTASTTTQSVQNTMPSSRSAFDELSDAIHSCHAPLRWRRVTYTHNIFGVLHGFALEIHRSAAMVGFRRKKTTKVVFVGGV